MQVHLASSQPKAFTYCLKIDHHNKKPVCYKQLFYYWNSIYHTFFY